MSYSYVTCPELGCTTRISRYNQCGACWVHAPKWGGYRKAKSRKLCVVCGKTTWSELNRCRECQGLAA